MSNETLLIELGTEELPPKALLKLSNAFSDEILKELVETQLIDAETASKATSYATPRRLAISIPNVSPSQPDQKVEKRGPAVQAAFNEDGTPTPAAAGFAKSCGVEISDLDRLKTDKGEWLQYTLYQKGKHITEIVPQIIDTACKRLPIPKRMRWGSGTAEFVRPVHWLIILHGDNLIPAEILSVISSNNTIGHRFHSSGEITIDHADSYEQVLLDQGSVVANFAERQGLITQQIETLTKTVKGVCEPDQSLLDEVTGLVEYPNALLGEFEPSFLKVPSECLISSMADHQKYFHLTDDQGNLLPNFITISNIKSSNPTQVCEGNERVLRARLSDAKFFWETDQKQPLANRHDLLNNVLFHIKLGSIADKSQRIQSLAGEIASEINADEAICQRAALLAKADLVTNMVGEFDVLQGTMGRYYAELDGEHSLVAEAIEQHYWPKFAGDQLPASPEAQAVALADRLDSLVGIYSAGEIPTGDKDPYGLRRASLGILRIIIEKQLPLNLSELVAKAAQIYSSNQDINISLEQQQQIVNYLAGRLPAHYQSQAIPATSINAVMACHPDSPLEFHQRLLAVNDFSKTEAADNLSAANKRISNILKKQQSDVADQIDSSLFIEQAETDLHKAIESIESSCLKQFDDGNYASGLEQLASLKEPVDQFFDKVMVMSDDDAVKNNRLALLQRLQNLFLRVADISHLQK